MDLLRSCYTTFMRFFRDNALEIKVRWFWADEEADVWPGHHLFGSGNWASERFDWPGPGEVLDAPRPWDDGHPIDGLIGDHYCGPEVSYTEGTAYPGVPLNALEDGRCACCVPLPPVCGDFVATLPATLRLRILNITLLPPSAPPSNYFVGQEFDLVGGPPAWLVDTLLSRDGCPFVGQAFIGCHEFPHGSGIQVFSWLLVETQGVFPAALITEAPLRIYFAGVPISGGLCDAQGDGTELWDIVAYDPADPPP